MVTSASSLSRTFLLAKKEERKGKERRGKRISRDIPVFLFHHGSVARVEVIKGDRTSIVCLLVKEFRGANNSTRKKKKRSMPRLGYIRFCS